jgi:hypothetical protein
VTFFRSLRPARFSILMAALASGLLTCVPSAQSVAQTRPHRVKTRRVSIRPPQIKTRGVSTRSLQTPAPNQIQPNIQSNIQPHSQSGIRPNAPRVGRAVGGAVRLNKAAIDPQAWALLTKMLRPTTDYEGVEVSNSGGKSSEERLQGDTKGRTRREYLTPPGMAGNILLTAPNQSYSYDAQERKLYLALWPLELGDPGSRLRALVRTGRIRVQVTGEQIVANRPATQITFWAVTGNENEEARRVLSLDKETGIRLQIDTYNRSGSLISSTYLKSVTLGVTLDPKMFNPNSLPPVTEKVSVFPQGQPMFTSVEPVRGMVRFAILQPAQLPAEYTLDGVWVFGPKTLRPSVLLRYSSGINHFSLFESLIPVKPNAPVELPRPGQLRPHRVLGGIGWHIPLPEGTLNMLYTGHLPDADLQALLASLQ